MDYKMKYLKYKKKYLNLKKNLGGNQESNQVIMEKKQLILDKYKTALISYIESLDKCKNNECKSDIDLVKDIELDTMFIETIPILESDKASENIMKFATELMENIFQEVTNIAIYHTMGDDDFFNLATAATIDEYIDHLLSFANKNYK